MQNGFVEFALILYVAPVISIMTGGTAYTDIQLASASRSVSSSKTNSFVFLMMLAEAQVEPTMIKKIVGHSGAMTLTERVYTHLDVKVLLEAINKI